MPDEIPGSATAVATPENVTPETPSAPPPEQITLPDTTPPEEPAPDEEAPEGEPESEPEPEAPKERSDEEIETAYEAGESLTRAEIDRLASIHTERQRLQESLQEQQRILTQVFPATIQKIVQEDLADLRLDDRTQEIMRNRLERRLGSVQQHARQVFEQPLVQLAAQQLVSKLEASGMKRQQAIDKVYSQNFLYRDYIDTAFEAGKKAGGVKPSDITADWVEKNRPEVAKAFESKFHKKYPERGGNARPAGSTGGGGGPLTYDRWMAMTPAERAKVPPEQEAAMIRSRMQGRR